MVERLRVLIADDEPDVREALAELLSRSPGLEVVGLAADAAEAIALARERRPDVALLDVRMPAGGGPRAAREILRRLPTVRVVALSAYGDPASILGMLRAGAVGYLPKGSPADELLAVLRGANGIVEPAELDGWAERFRAEERRAMEDRRWARRIRGVIARGGPAIAFQPIVDLRTGEAVGFEALARFSGTPSRPDAWFGAAARLGFLVELELAAARRALSRLPELPGHVSLAVNASPHTIRSPAFAEALRAAGRTDRVVVELTERAEGRDLAAVAEALEGLRREGVRVAIDDLASDRGALEPLALLRPDLVKLDITLVRGIDADPIRETLVSALASLATAMGARVVAEGIETPAELHVLRALGIPLGQGFLLGRPHPLEAWVAGHAPA
jgi:EAL domain-containing protein (putative c-di-GMP-specific phosphodiesterase class I)/CheY-like chemotaxis protein